MKTEQTSKMNINELYEFIKDLLKEQSMIENFQIRFPP